MSTDFLHRKYRDLNTSPEVKAAAKKHERRTGERLIPQRPEARIQAYLTRLKAILEPEALATTDGRAIATAQERTQRNIALLKHALHRQFVITPDEVPDSYFQSIIRRRHDEGRPLEDIPADQRLELIEPLIADQQRSLDLWVDYLTSKDAKYPDELKYWAFCSMLGMSTYDKEKQAFGKRGKGSVSPFPELNQEALSLTLGAVEKFHAQGRYTKEDTTKDIGYGIDEAQMSQFREAVQQENFPKIYAWLIEQFKPIANELLKITEGKWVHYPQGSEPTKLVTTLRDYGTGWCIRGEATARRYLQGDRQTPGNDLHVYYSNNEHGQPTVPRAVIVMRDGIISEVRGIAKQEGVDPEINEVVKAKLDTIPDGKRYQKRSSDNRQLTTLEHKVKTKQAFNKADLLFLYEVNAPIEWFGYGKSPRVAELRKGRDIKADILTIFECTAAQIAHTPKEVTPNTKAYVGRLYKGIFKQLAHLEHIYISFPEQRLGPMEWWVGGMDAEQLITAIEATPETPGATRNMRVYWYAKSMLHNSAEFVPTKERQLMRFIRLTVADLGFPNGATTKQILAKTQELGLELCPPDAGPHLRLQLTNQPMDEWLCMGMKPITDSGDNPNVFIVEHGDDGVWLFSSWTWLDARWSADNTFVFRLPPASPGR